MRRCVLLLVVIFMGLFTLLIVTGTGAGRVPNSLNVFLPFLYIVTLDSEPAGSDVMVHLSLIFTICFVWHIYRFGLRTRRNTLPREDAS